MTHADPFVVAVDLLSQAEHGPDSPAILVTTVRGARPRRSIEAYRARSCRRCRPATIAEPAWRDYGQVIVVDGLDEAYAVADEFAAEHVQVLTQDPP